SFYLLRVGAWRTVSARTPPPNDTRALTTAVSGTSITSSLRSRSRSSATVSALPAASAVYWSGMGLPLLSLADALHPHPQVVALPHPPRRRRNHHVQHHMPQHQRGHGEHSHRGRGGAYSVEPGHQADLSGSAVRARCCSAACSTAAGSCSMVASAHVSRSCSRASPTLDWSSWSIEHRGTTRHSHWWQSHRL